MNWLNGSAFEIKNYMNYQYEMIRLKVPIIVVIIGEGASGGALGIGVGDKVFMMENTWYSVISPESCSSILWRSWDKKEIAAEQLKLTADKMLGFGLIDGIIPEPLGGAHQNHDTAITNLRTAVASHLDELCKIPTDELLRQRYAKFRRVGEFAGDE